MKTLAGPLRRHAGLALIILLFLAAGALRLNDLSLYTPDSSRYLIWGNSLAHGQGYLDATLPDPDPYVVHAPLYPLLIAPVEFFAPFSVPAVKAWTLCWGAAAVALFYFWLLRAFGRGWALGGALLLAANPLFGMYATEVLSDAPFLAALLALFILAERHEEGAGGGRRGALPLVLAVVAAVTVREVGAAAAAAVVCWLLTKKRYRTAIAVTLAAGAVMALWYVRNNVLASTSAEYAGGNVSLLFRKVITGRDVPLLNEFALRAWIAVKSYGAQLGGLIVGPMYSGRFGHLFFAPSGPTAAIERSMEGAQALLGVAAAAASAAGCFLDRRHPHAALRLLFAGVYVAAVLLYPINDIRFLVPLLPLLIRWHLVAFRSLAERTAALRFLLTRRGALAAIAVLMIPNFLSTYEMVKANTVYRTDPARFSAGGDEDALFTSLYARPWPALGGWIRSHTGPDDLIVSPYKQLATVVGGRKVFILDKGATLSDFENVLRFYGAAWVVAPRRWGTIRVYEPLMIASRRFRFDEAFSAGDLALYRVIPEIRNPAAAPAGRADTSATASGALRRGWRALAGGKLDEANGAFREAYRREPLQPEIIYYLLVSSTLRGDSSQAAECYRRLYGAPQAGSYLDPASAFIRAMNQLHDARARKDHAGVMVQSKEAAGTYWRLGAPWQARAVMNGSLDEDSSYMFGNLWGTYYNLVLGDTARAKKYLGHAAAIDPPNPVVAAFRTVLASADSIGRSASPSQRARLHLAIAEIYRKIELPESAFDEGELALAAEPGNIPALLFLAGAYEARGRTKLAEAMYRAVLDREIENATARARLDTLARRARR